MRYRGWGIGLQAGARRRAPGVDLCNLQEDVGDNAVNGEHGAADELNLKLRCRIRISIAL